MVDYDSKFWLSDSPHKELAKEFERNVIVSHPDIVTSDNVLVSRLEKWCSYCASNVTYYEYTGPPIR